MASRCEKYTSIATVFMRRTSGLRGKRPVPGEFPASLSASLGFSQDFRGYAVVFERIANSSGPRFFNAYMTSILSVLPIQ
jgi:hypothetical protein